MSNAARKIISEKILFGPKEENELTVANEIIAGTRPRNWNVAGHPDHDVWVSIVELKQEKQQREMVLYKGTKVFFHSKELIEAITPHVYPTSQIVHGEITIEDYITSIADWLAKEMFDRRMPKEVLPLFAELAMLRHQK